MKNILIRIFPYIISLLFGLVFFFVGFNQGIEDLKSFYLSISGTLLGIPIVFLLFEVSKSISERKLSKNVFEYIKMQIDTLLLGLMNRIVKLLYSYESIQTSPQAINLTFKLTKANLISILKENKHIGFAFLGDLKDFERKYRNHLDFALSANHLDTNMLNILIEIGKSIRSFIYYSENTKDLFLIHNDKARYIIKKATELDKRNPDDAYLLMKMKVKSQFPCKFDYLRA